MFRSLALLALCATIEPPPNIVLILMDDLGWADLRDTPNIDKLASRGIKFTNAYAACPVCSPTRASILTGKYPARLNLTDWLPGRADRPTQKLLRPKIRQELPLEETTLAEKLKPAGYVCASIGKWHLGGANFLPERQGFDVNVGGTNTGSPPGGYFKFKTPTLAARTDEEYLTDRLTEEAEAFIEKNKDKPFFLYLPHYAVHIPLQAKKELLAKHQGKPNPIYSAMVESMDESVGRIVKKLDELKLADRTVVVFTSDNGGLSVKEGPNTPATSNAPLRAGKGYLYEGGIRVPMIVSWPGTIKPGVSDGPVISNDLFPTLLELAGVKAEGHDGVNLLKEKHDALFWHYPHYSNQGGKPGGAVRRGDHKLIEHYEDGALELFDLKIDPGENKNLKDDKPEAAARLHKLLVDWRASVGAQMPMPNPDYKK